MTSPRPSPALDRKTILVADDSGYTRSRIRTVLREFGLRVVEANDGDSAVDLFEIHRPLVVIMDQIMRGRSGIEASRSILLGDRSVRIILLTSINDARFREQAYQAGVIRVVAKSDLSDLRSAVADLLEG